MKLRLNELFSAASTNCETPQVDSPSFERTLTRAQSGIEFIVDRFTASQACAGFVRIPSGATSSATISLAGDYQAEACAAGGWLLVPADTPHASYWIPQPPQVRRLDPDGHILSNRSADIGGFQLTPTRIALDIPVPDGHVLDLALWKLPADEPDLAAGLKVLSSLECQAYFMWSSHTSYARPADLYLHLIHGHVYENHEVWPKYWRVCSELDAYALYVTLGGLLRSTRKRLYALLRSQIVSSVIARQTQDGGWYHGEWTGQMESHFRLHAGAMHLLAAEFEETGDPVVRGALERAAAFAVTKTDRLNSGRWYLHDSLEESPDRLNQYPFRYQPSRALGKSASNLLVLNTHLDTNIAVKRYRQVSGDRQYDDLISSASAATHAVINLRPAEWLYCILYRAIGLTFLPASRASALPLPLRVVKRVAWKYLIPQLPRIKALYPRLVMPGGYIERELSMFAFSVRYLPVNLMDLVRTRRLFDDATLDHVLQTSFLFTQTSGITQRWKETRGKEDDSLGFWAEALYHLCLAHPDLKYRAWLAQSMLDLEDNRLGLSPSLLGANSEAIAPELQHPCPIPRDARLRIANLSHGAEIEVLVANASDQPILLEWQAAPMQGIVWSTGDGTMLDNAVACPTISPRDWLRGVAIQPSAQPQVAP